MSRYILLSFLLLWQTCELLSHHIILSRVTDTSTGGLLSGVTLFITSIQKETIRDESGSFKISDLNDEEYDLTVSFLGFVTREIRVNPDSLTGMQLEPADFHLAEIFVTNSTGKAEQIFMRGFDINPGTDIRIRIDGKPIKMMSRATGNTAMDLHFLIPELFYSSSKLELDFSLETILGAVWDETQFEAESSYVSDSEPVLELHYTSEIPFYVKCSGTYFF